MCDEDALEVKNTLGLECGCFILSYFKLTDNCCHVCFYRSSRERKRRAGFGTLDGRRTAIGCLVSVPPAVVLIRSRWLLLSGMESDLRLTSEHRPRTRAPTR